jgi:hypothetical protein
MSFGTMGTRLTGLGEQERGAHQGLAHSAKESGSWGP